MSKPRPQLVSSKRLHAGVTAAAPDYLSGLDIFHAHAGIPLILCFKQGLDLELAERTFKTVLASYPNLTGRYKKDQDGHVYLDSNDAGMDWNVYRCKGPMPYGPHNPVGKDIHRFYKMYMPWKVVDHDQPLMQINFHVFDDGGVLFCGFQAHSAVDGSSFWGMMQDWTRICKGEAAKGQTFNRQVLIDLGKPAPDPAAYELMVAPPFRQWAGTMLRLGWHALFSLKSETFQIPAATVNRWREQAKAELAPTSAGVSSVELVTSYLMKAFSPVMPKGVARSVGIVLDLRYKRRLKLPRDFFGNALCYAEARYTAEELAQGSLPQLAEKCRPANEQVSTEALLRMLALTETYRQKKAVWRLIFKPTIETLNAGLILNNCVQFPMYEVDFGSGTPSWYDITPMTIRMVMVTPTPAKDGGLTLYLTARKAELAALKAQMQRDGIPVTLA
jgi:shikimate O-hydroxycinnamoyltransferase